MTEQDGSMPTSADIELAARQLGELIALVDDADLTAPSPCEGWTVRDLLTHIRGFAAASTAAANRTPFPVDADELHEGLPRHLHALAAAWAQPQAWEGSTEAAEIRTPAAVAGSAALQELLVHGWDLATAIDKPYRPDAGGVRRCLNFLSSLSVEDRSRPSGPKMTPLTDASTLDRLIALSGRNPKWNPSTRGAP